MLLCVHSGCDRSNSLIGLLSLCSICAGLMYERIVADTIWYIVRSMVTGGGCGIGLGLGWGFGAAYGTKYLDSKLKFEGIDFDKMKSSHLDQERLEKSSTQELN